jgi:hypothetical protein
MNAAETTAGFVVVNAPAFVQPNRFAWRLHPTGMLWFRPLARGPWELQIADSEEGEDVVFWVCCREDIVATGHAESEAVAMHGAWRAFVREFALGEPGRRRAA